MMRRCQVIGERLAAALVTMFFVMLLVPALYAADARYSAQQYQQRQKEIITQAQQDKMAAEEQAQAAQQKLLTDKTTLENALKTVRSAVHRLAVETAALRKEHGKLVAQQKKLQQEKDTRTQRLNELVGFIRTTARDTAAMLRHSQLNAVNPQRTEVLQSLLQPQHFPSMEAVRSLRDLLLAQMRASGEVQVLTLPILNRLGEETTATTVVIGDFSAAYRDDEETGFLLYSPPSGRFFALSVLPSGSLQRQINAYLAGDGDSVAIDIGHGASLRQLTYRTNFSDQLGQGGVIVWPIMAIGIIAFFLIVERIWFLRRNRFDAGGLLHQLRPLISAGNWEQSVELCQQAGDKPLPRVLLTGLRYHAMQREDLENGLQEAILGEIPRLERFLSTLAVMASIAPLLGLLGTVTGMINTFQIITFHGTSDPRLMSGGISEALVTTMLGLGVAIPIMLCHSLLSRRVETIIAQLEEKSISFVNMVCQARLGSTEQK